MSRSKVDSVALVAEGLLHASPDVVHDALRCDEAARVVARWLDTLATCGSNRIRLPNKDLRRTTAKRRKRNPVGEFLPITTEAATTVQSTAITATATLSPQRSHWLWQILDGDSVASRQSVVRALLSHACTCPRCAAARVDLAKSHPRLVHTFRRNTHPASPQDSNSEESKPTRTLPSHNASIADPTEQHARLVHSLLHRLETHLGPSARVRGPPRSPSEPPVWPVVLESIALLQHVLLLDQNHHEPIDDQEWNSWLPLFLVWRTPRNPQANGGLAWLTQLAWHVAMIGMDRLPGQSHPYSNLVERTWNANVLAALLRWISRVVLCAPHEAQVPQIRAVARRYLWTRSSIPPLHSSSPPTTTATTTTTPSPTTLQVAPDEDTLSPLATLVGLYHALASTSPPERVNSRSLATVLPLLHAMIEPRTNVYVPRMTATKTAETTDETPVGAAAGDVPIPPGSSPAVRELSAESVVMSGVEDDEDEDDDEEEDEDGDYECSPVKSYVSDLEQALPSSDFDDDHMDMVDEQEEEQVEHDEMGGNDNDDNDEDDTIAEEDADDDDEEEDDPVAERLLNRLRFQQLHPHSSDEDDGDDEGDGDEEDTQALASLDPPLEERRKLYLIAARNVLEMQYPHHPHTVVGAHSRQKYLNVAGEASLLQSVNVIVEPPKKPIQTKVILRRAPTQEEFFRGSLSTNPVALSQLPSADPTVADLRQHVADDLQMSDSAELIEILVGGKILDNQLRLRVVHATLWRDHLLEHGSGAAMSSQPSFFSSAGGLSVIFNSVARSGRSVTADTPVSQLPPMVATYRLAGVDGEATEDTIRELVDPDAPVAAASPAQVEEALEQQFGLTRLITEGRGLFVLLRSIQHNLMDTLRRIRRDDWEVKNWAREKFQADPPYPGLILLGYCAKLASNRKKMLQARAPTVLLTLLLEVLKALEEPNAAADSSTVSNATADKLQELIEILTSDISTSVSRRESGVSEDEGYASDSGQDASSMPLLLQSIETICLSAPLRNVIAKLLPFLTYGQANLSRELAQHFNRQIDLSRLAELEAEDSPSSSKSAILARTFVQTAISLPPNEVCNSLRSELIRCGFVDRLSSFIVEGMPNQPPTWSTALWPKGEGMEDLPKKKKRYKGKGTSIKRLLETSWKEYFARGGTKTAFGILSGLCQKHVETQSRLSRSPEFLRSCHWLEATSSNVSAGVDTRGLGLSAETLLDEIMEDNMKVSRLVNGVRQKTRMRKKELAEERRAKALGKISVGGMVMGKTTSMAATVNPDLQTGVRATAASFFSPVFGLFRDSSVAAQPRPAEDGMATAARAPIGKDKKSSEKPAWMDEMENMEDESGLKCAVCQEGRTLQPSELLGLYAFVKKVSIPLDHCGSRASIDGTMLLKALPKELPKSLVGSHTGNCWFLAGRSAGDDLNSTSSPSYCVGASGDSRRSLFTTTVSAGNAIHFSCHRRARQADQSHSKAPKAEWEGANLRNNRVKCNIILPLVSSTGCSKVPLVAVDSALSEHQASISSLLGATPTAMMWTVLHDVRLLLLRLAYGESLNVDCGGGSLASNVQLLYYQLSQADMYEKNAQVDQPEVSQHARCLSAGFLAACEIVKAKDFSGLNRSNLQRGVADAAAMAGLTSILFHNNHEDGHEDTASHRPPHPKRQWQIGKPLFLQGLLLCAGRRHAIQVEGSGCQTSIRRVRSSSFCDWDVQNDTPEKDTTVVPARRGRRHTAAKKASLWDFACPLRPMLTLFGILDGLSAEFSLHMEDVDVQQSAQRLVSKIELCQKCTNIDELLQVTGVEQSEEEIMDFFQQGILAA
jgi:hypothetical protein